MLSNLEAYIKNLKKVTQQKQRAQKATKSAAKAQSSAVLNF